MTEIKEGRATPDPVSQAADPAQDADISRELPAEMDEAATSREHWKILLTSGMGFFTDAYDLFIIGVAAAMIANEVKLVDPHASLARASAIAERDSFRPGLAKAAHARGVPGQRYDRFQLPGCGPARGHCGVNRGAAG